MFIEFRSEKSLKRDRKIRKVRKHVLEVNWSFSLNLLILFLAVLFFHRSLLFTPVFLLNVSFPTFLAQAQLGIITVRKL